MREGTFGFVVGMIVGALLSYGVYTHTRSNFINEAVSNGHARFDSSQPEGFSWNRGHSPCDVVRCRYCGKEDWMWVPK